VGGLYFAADSHRYTQGVMKLVPPPQRDKAKDLLHDLDLSLWRWLLARIFSMVVTTIASAVVLLILGIPMPVVLGVIAGLLTFLPNIGALLGLVLPAILALQQSVMLAIIVISSFIVLQIVESYILTPLVQQKVARLPAAMVLFAQILAGTFFGILGVILTPPLLVVMLVMVNNRNRPINHLFRSGCVTVMLSDHEQTIFDCGSVARVDSATA
jgi:predicted PurR-regulated permease PerM